jgi:hypothetical protein
MWKYNPNANKEQTAEEVDAQIDAALGSFVPPTNENEMEI